MQSVSQAKTSKAGILRACQLGTAALAMGLLAACGGSGGGAAAPPPSYVLSYNHGSLVTHPGGGTGGADASALQSSLGMGILGWTISSTLGYRIADSFTVSDPAGWDVSNVVFYAYQTNAATSPSTITAINYRVWNGSPDSGTSTVVFGDTTTNRLTASSWTNIYRVTETDLANVARPVMGTTCSAGFHLAPGTYWIDFQMTGDAGLGGPYAPAITVLGQTTTGAALQYNSTTWATLTDVGPQGFPFQINGSITH